MEAEDQFKLPQYVYSPIANLFKFRFVQDGNQQVKVRATNGVIENRFYAWEKKFEKVDEQYIVFKIKKSNYYHQQKNYRYNYTQYFYKGNVELSQITSPSQVLYLYQTTLCDQHTGDQETIFVNYPLAYVQDKQVESLSTSYDGTIKFQDFYGLRGNLTRRQYQNGKVSYGIELTGLLNRSFTLTPKNQ